MQHSLQSAFTITPIKRKLQTKTPLNTKNIQYQSLPSEIAIKIFTLLSTSDLLVARMASHLWKDRIHSLLINRTIVQLRKVQDEAQTQSMQLISVEGERKVPLAHYGEFLNNLSGSEIAEAVHFNNPPVELKSVCECLCILKGSEELLAYKRHTAGNKAIPWALIKKQMVKSDFRSWLINLRQNVDIVHIDNVKRVSQIIIQDPLITYDRLREVSLTGYRLLIAVAAVLQYRQILEEIKVFKAAVSVLQNKVKRNIRFLKSFGVQITLAQSIKSFQMESVANHLAPAALI